MKMNYISFEVTTAQWESERTRVDFLKNEDRMQFRGDIDKARFLQIVKYLLKCSFMCPPNFPIVWNKPVGLYGAGRQ